MKTNKKPECILHKFKIGDSILDIYFPWDELMIISMHEFKLVAIEQYGHTYIFNGDGLEVNFFQKSIFQIEKEGRLSTWYLKTEENKNLIINELNNLKKIKEKELMDNYHNSLAQIELFFKEGKK